MSTQFAAHAVYGIAYRLAMTREGSVESPQSQEGYNQGILAARRYSSSGGGVRHDRRSVPRIQIYVRSMNTDNQLGFSAIVIKSLNEERREITGMASTPQLDRVNDIVEPLGLTFANDTPLLLNHDHSKPVGTVKFGRATAHGLPFKATIAKVEEPGVVKDRTDESWHSVKHGLIKGVSIGFFGKKSEPVGKGNARGTRYTEAAVHELSLVAIPCNPGALITGIQGFK